jgi:phage shock protein A
VCISREAAIKSLQDADTVEAQKKQIAVLDQAILDLKAEIVKAQIELAKVVGEKTGLEKNAIRDAAIIEMLLQNVKKKRNAFITLF